MRPEPRAIYLLLAWFALALVAAFRDSLLEAVAFASLVPVVVLGLDLIRARRMPPVLVRRQVAATLALRNWCRVELHVQNAARSDQDIELFDHYPIGGETKGLPRRVLLPAGTSALVRYGFRPLERGASEFGRVELRIRSPWRMWQIRRYAGESATVKVYPDFGTLQGYAILAVDNAVSQLGVRKRQRRGEGLELHQLREYRQGDSLRQIDWKATSRQQRIISKEYEDERNQQVVFMLDCGRTMRAVDRGVAHFDHALNSALLLTYVAVRQGDAVGLMTFGGPERWLPPQKGPVALNAMLQAVYDLETGTRAADYTTAAMTLMVRQRRRALVVMLTNMRDEDGDEVAAAVRLMRRRHLVILASLRETVLDQVLEEPVRDFQDAVRVGAIHQYLQARGNAYRRLRGRGIAALDVAPADLPTSIVNRYLEVKRTGAL